MRPGLRIALLEARLSGELAALVRRYGAEPHCVPAVREEEKDCREEISGLLDQLRAEASTIFVFSTGVGVDALFAVARRLGRLGELEDALRRGTAVCRGPKPAAALKRVGLAASVMVKPPYTTGDLVLALEPIQMAGRSVVLVHYGERNVPLVSALEVRGARLRELMLYEWRLPEDVGPVRELIAQIIEGGFAAVVFTSQIQARHLFRIAAEMGLAEALREALLGRTVVAAVGPTCARALAELGVSPDVVPENPKMGSMLFALSRRLAAGTEAGP
ncbi:MAG TPA: uroporphyrinogen-III synthase [Myxococcaceae bacterium]|nr:uroporphyrinogen-III synthase [Myxococcaceae bacterium]